MEKFKLEWYEIWTEQIYFNGVGFKGSRVRLKTNFTHAWSKSLQFTALVILLSVTVLVTVMPNVMAPLKGLCKFYRKRNCWNWFIWYMAAIGWKGTFLERWVRTRNANWRERFNTFDLLIKDASFVKGVNNIFNVKSSWSKLASTRRSIVLSLPLQ